MRSGTTKVFQSIRQSACASRQADWHDSQNRFADGAISERMRTGHHRQIASKDNGELASHCLEMP